MYSGGYFCLECEHIPGYFIFAVFANNKFMFSARDEL